VSTAEGADGDDADDHAVAEARALLERTAGRLAAGGARDEALARFVPGRRVLGFPARPAMKPLGRVWRLGVLLLAPDGTPYATGAITRAIEPGHPGHVAVSAEQRREMRAAAHRGPFAEGETVDYDAAPIDLTPDALRATTGPLFLRGGRLLVRWSASAPDDAAAPFERYLAERADLLLHPPERA
jgi:hypothetical protein